MHLHGKGMVTNLRHGMNIICEYNHKYIYTGNIHDIHDYKLYNLLLWYRPICLVSLVFHWCFSCKLAVFMCINLINMIILTRHEGWHALNY